MTASPTLLGVLALGVSGMLLGSSSCATRTPASPASTSAPTSAEKAQPPAPSAAEAQKGALALMQEPPGPTSANRWRALGPNAYEPVREKVQNPGTAEDARERAILALGWVNHPDAVTLLGGLAKDEKRPLVQRTLALQALGQAGGAAATAQVTPLVANAKPELRVAAAKALGVLSGTDARAALESQLATEEDVSVREALQQNLDKTQP